jgi:hypothetical protein
MNVRVVCGGCRRVLADQADAYPNDLGNCGSCESPLKEVTIDITDEVELREEFDATGSNLQGDVTHERISRTDGNTTSELAADLDKSVEIRSVRSRHVEGSPGIRLPRARPPSSSRGSNR